MLLGVKINGRHSETNYGCYLAEKTVERARVKTEYAEVEGADGVIDYTEVIAGRATFDNRPVSARLMFMGTPAEQVQKADEIVTEVHGKIAELIFDDEPTWVYKGRCEVIVDKNDRDPNQSCFITISMDAYPYKQSATTTTKSLITSSSGTSNGVSVSKLSKVESVKNNSTSYYLWLYVENYPFKIPPNETLTNMLGYMIPAGSVTLKGTLKKEDGTAAPTGNSTATMTLREVSL